ncbi:MAG: hypothetical protein ACYTFO_00180 [Planctomycetota bacterium]|jgi:hypothetical protein
MKRRHVWWVLIVLVVLGGAWGILIWVQSSGMHDPYKQTGAEIIDYLASEDFVELSPEAKEKYFGQLLASAEGDSFRRLIFSQGETVDALDDASYNRLMDNAMLMGMKAMDEGMFGPGGRRPSPPTEEGESRPTARWRSEGEKPASEDSDRPRGFRRRGEERGFTPRRLRYIIANSPPERRARFVERIKAFTRAFGRSGGRPHRRPE